MKNLLMISLFMAAPAFATPNVAGTYTCRDNTVLSWFTQQSGIEVVDANNKITVMGLDESFGTIACQNKSNEQDSGEQSFKVSTFCGDDSISETLTLTTPKWYSNSTRSIRKLSENEIELFVTETDQGFLPISSTKSTSYTCTRESTQE